jgi:undecaprenyl-phosphate 4-deoxy-4-formamido-L-arabinose transferase
MLPMIETDLTNSNPVQTCFALSIVIPVYNGARSIADLVRPLEQLSIAGGHEIVLVNDGSADDSLAVCHALFDKARVPVTLVNLARNHGEHNAVMAGLRYATGAHVITMDDDLQNPPEEVERLLAYSQRSGKEVVYTYYDDKRHAAWRNLASRFTNRVAEFVLDKPRGMYLSSFRCMSAFVVREITRYEGPFPYVDGLILLVTQDIDRLLVAGGDGDGRGTLLLAAAGLGLADGGGAAALGRTAVDPRHHRRVSRHGAIPSVAPGHCCYCRG